MATSRPKLLWSPEAEKDLDDAYDYLATAGSPKAADNLLRAIDTVCRSLVDHPGKGRSRSELAPDLRSIVVHPYEIFYRPTDAAIESVRVLRGRCDIEAIFGEP
ncbi:type II toxin-antitoxin system RelE/ParE family toxin [Rhodoplanes sp. TEM]|uniref:Type II toxin-antitoxin system RelE/ParE family toxin n=1 Tax=Rhodoplanes tepidamans TaxID=200616 RepID=A0ABT5JFP9_RHOTP|nr:MULTISPECIES: type II toxin-antitoxin system RelE/ParE family toxin [Rhodoplanes]MDC7788119.1 type II toxin-antitoxin system RelE/ParE family toxin [Rhodoplanes tepidamans]MDC7984601.1 type II toxin-antitoxin system RelE/ParE family toxin [Rhodoplanes sp. TEM]MDQ0355590.1 toxin ParE1/3/4 [Rhodoplanes tepidamans]